MLHYEKYVDVVNFFISKIHLILELNLSFSKDNINRNLIGSIDDINEFRNVFIQIENFINSMIHNNNYNHFGQNDLVNTNIENQIIENNKQENIVLDDNNIDNNSQKEEILYQTLEERVYLLEDKIL